jgi:hypothetical protein
MSSPCRFPGITGKFTGYKYVNEQSPLRKPLSPTAIIVNRSGDSKEGVTPSSERHRTTSPICQLAHAMAGMGFAGQLDLILDLRLQLHPVGFPVLRIPLLIIPAPGVYRRFKKNGRYLQLLYNINRKFKTLWELPWEGVGF